MTRGTDKSGLKSAGLPEKPSRKGHGHRAAEDDMEQRRMDAEDTITAGDNPGLMAQNPNIGKVSQTTLGPGSDHLSDHKPTL
jgi:hypothetical protein